jgi:hypothetical protein
MFSLSGGVATIFPSGDAVPVIFDENSFTAVIPLSAIGHDNAFNFATVLGSFAEPTDCAPNGGSLHSPDGSVVPAPTIGSISGKVVDAQTGDPLRGDVQPFATVELRRCVDSECLNFTTVNSQPADRRGQFLFRSDFSERPLLVGIYQVAAFAEQFQSSQAEPVNVREGANRNVGAVPLPPFPLQLFELQSCGDLPPGGGRCRYSVRLDNRQTVPFQGAAWSVVDSGDIGSFTGFTLFQPQPPRERTVDPAKSTVVHFAFQVPGSVQDGAFICARVFAGEGNNPFFNTIGQRDLFCIVKGFTGEFLVMSEQEVRQLRQQLTPPPVTTPKQKGFQEQVRHR